MAQVSNTKAAGSINQKLALPLLLITTCAILLHGWSIFIYYPGAPGWNNDGVDYWASQRWIIGLVTTTMALTTYALITRATWHPETNVRFARRTAVVLLFLLFLSLTLMVIPFATAGWEIIGYNDPKGYAPYSWGVVGEVLTAFVLIAWCNWGFHLIIFSLTALVISLLATPAAFARSQKKFYGIIASSSAIYCLGFLVVFWPWISLWIFD